MSAATFTPGPWAVGQGMYRERTNDYPPVVTHEARDICVLESHFGDADANARLIAAAPELLETAREYLRAVVHTYGLPPHLDRVTEALKYAIAKADGAQ